MFLREDIWQYLLHFLVLIALSLFIGLTASFITFHLLKKWTSYHSKQLERAFVRYCKRPIQFLFILLAIGFVIPHFDLSKDIIVTVKKVHGILLILTVSWLLVACLHLVEAAILHHFDIEVRDNLRARAVRTQIKVFKNVATFIILLVALSMILMSFDQIRQLGISLLASAGVAGIIIGFAAQKSIATLLAGIQIAITQPIRLDDVVIVEGEWGWIEEITLTYVVVKIWDLRRLVIPITYFIEHPFQNWTRTSADILGSVFIYADYLLPVEELRNELKKILNASPLWDKKVCVLQVTKATEKTMELRALMSAADSPTAWDLRCEIREKLINFIRKKHPECLPVFRATLERKEVH